MDKVKNFLKFILGYENEYTKREMSVFSRVVLILLLFIIPVFCILYVTHMKFGLSYRMCKMFWDSYLGFAKILITGFAVTFIAQMGKAFLSKREEENNKLTKKLNEIEEDDE